MTRSAERFGRSSTGIETVPAPDRSAVSCGYTDRSNMTLEEFRRVALGFRGTTEHVHHGHPDFHVRGKAFACLGDPDAACAILRLTPSQQQRFVRDHPDCFTPVQGAAGRRGATNLS